jgi:hypothetical protein
VPGFPPLKSVTIKLQTAASRSTEGEAEFLVFALGTRYSAEEASRPEMQNQVGLSG